MIGNFHPSYYYSRLTIRSEKKYHSYELETLAVVEFAQKFQCFLLGRKFKIMTDCMAFQMAKIHNVKEKAESSDCKVGRGSR